MFAKLIRFLTCWLPVSRARRGTCNHCGACCRLPSPCLFLRTREDGASHCAIYAIRPPSCRKYPRTATELITPDTCGYWFATPRDFKGIPIVEFPLLGRRQQSTADE